MTYGYPAFTLKSDSGQNVAAVSDNGNPRQLHSLFGVLTGSHPANRVWVYYHGFMSILGFASVEGLFLGLLLVWELVWECHESFVFHRNGR